MGAKPFRDAQRPDLVAFANRRSRERVWRNRRNDGTFGTQRRRVDLKDSTLAGRRRIVRTFYRWLEGDGEKFPDKVLFLKTRRPNLDRIPTDELLDRDDLAALLQACQDYRERALVAVLRDTGTRAGEFCAFNLGSVQFDEYGAVLTMPKGAPGLETGARRLRVFECVPYLQKWFEAHPRKKQRSEALFFSVSRRAPGRRMTPNALFLLVKRLGKRAGLQKRIYPHLFRHTAATERARLGWSEAEMRAFFGWTKASTMPAIYVHLAGKDYETMELARRGLAPVAANDQRALATQACLQARPATSFPPATVGNAAPPSAPTRSSPSNKRKNSNWTGWWPPKSGKRWSVEASGFPTVPQRRERRVDWKCPARLHSPATGLEFGGRGQPPRDDVSQSPSPGASPRARPSPPVE